MTVTRSDNGSLEDGLVSRTLNLLAFLVTTVAYLPIVITARYAVFHGDDFCTVPGTLSQPAANVFKAALIKAWDIYTTWQGTYVYNILTPLLHPLHHYSYLKCRLILMALLVFAFLSALCLCHELCLRFMLGKRAGVLAMILLLPIIGFRELSDPVLWYVGAMNYMVPTVFLGVGLTLMLRSQRKQSKGERLLACLCLFLAGGGTPMIGGLGAAITLLPLVLVMIEEKRIDRTLLAFFLSIFSGDLVNVLAPGNYVRAPGKLMILQSLHAAFKMYGLGLQFYYSRVFFLFTIILAFSLGLRYGRGRRWSVFSVAMIGLLITPIIPAFPYVLGYSIAEVTEETGRIWLAVDLALTGCISSAAFFLGGQLRMVIGEKTRKRIKIGLSLVATILLLFSFPQVDESIPVQIMENLRNGKIAAYSAEWHEIYDMLSMRPGEDIVIGWQPDVCVGALKVELGAAPDHYINYQMARYFGNSSIVDAWYAATYGVPGSADYAE